MDKFNIAQGNAINDPTWRVIDGQRTDSGHLAAGAKVVMDGLSREDAVGFATQLNLTYLTGVADGMARAVARWSNAMGPGPSKEIVPRAERSPTIMGKLTPCCDNEDRGMGGGCRSCGDPCL